MRNFTEEEKTLLYNNGQPFMPKPKTKIEEITERLAMALTHSEQGSYEKNKEFIVKSLIEVAESMVVDRMDEDSEEGCIWNLAREEQLEKLKEITGKI